MSPNTYDGGAALPDVEAGATATGNPAAAGSGAATRPSTARGNIAARRGQFMIAARRPNGLQPLGMQPLNFAYIEQTLRGAPDIDVVDTVGPKSIMGALADGISDTPSVLVAQMTEQKASVLHQQAQGRMIVERDNHLTLMDPVLQPPPLVVGAVPSGSATLATVVTVLGKDNAPVRDAEVYLFGSFMPGTGVTDERGQVTVTLFGETVQTVRGLYVKPKADYWSFYQTHPAISTSEENIVILRALADWPALQNFPQQQVLGWGQKAMRLDQVPGSYRGQGVKVAVIDSGAATSHDDLRNVKFGFDILNKKTNPNSWNEDSIAHGSHCTGIIAGADNTHGVRGFAPDAEIHECKLFPGGQVSQLIDALEYCIEQQIDVANLSLGGVPPSEALEQQILRAKRAGVACIVAAGNSGGAVQYPASSPNVLAVSAVGKLNEFPSDSYHTQTLTTMVDANGFFAPKFTCFGPEVGVCGPGVAITSSVPPNNFAVWDGTSMATPHITGLAALVLAHHNDFQGSYKARTAERVERLFQIIKQSARRLNLGDPRMTGYGLPDAVSALKLGAQAGQQVAGVAAAATPQAMLAPMQAAYNDQVAYAQQQQAALNNQWAQLANPYGPALAVMGFDPGGGFASGLIPPLYHYRPGLAPSAFGQGW
jgi:subtilisin family serine protease